MLDLIVGVFLIFFLFAGIFISIALILESSNLVFKPSNKKTYRTERDAWDKVDGGTYVTMQDGSVRLDNNGGR